MKATKIPTFPENIEEAIYCSKFGYYTSLHKTSLLVYHQGQANDNDIDIYQLFLGKSRASERSNNYYSKDLINYSILYIYEYISDTYLGRITKYSFTHIDYPAVVFLIDHFSCENSCDSCDGTTESSISIRKAMSQKDIDPQYGISYDIVFGIVKKEDDEEEDQTS